MRPRSDDHGQHGQEALNELALFAGAGGGILGGHLLGWRTVCAVEWEPYPAGVLIARQNDGILPPFPIWDDVRTFDGRPWREIVDVVSGGFPCQDISLPGGGDGLDGERSGLWREMARIIGEVRPRYVLVENSPALTFRGLGVVLGDLAKMGFDSEWGVISAADTGAPHERERIWIMADAHKISRQAWVRRVQNRTRSVQSSHRKTSVGVWRDECPGRDFGVADGLAYRVDRLEAAGNGQVPLVVREAVEVLR